MTVPECMWNPPPTDIALSNADVHVWRASLDLDASYLQRLQALLTEDEITRAAHFRLRRDREHFVAARGLLRLILSRYLQEEPGQIRFCYGRHGKPELATAPGQRTLSFNVSHSRGLALYAVTYSGAIGIDLEYVRPMRHGQQIAARFFSPREHAWLCALPAHTQHEAFFRCWTRKEAYIKARGEGLSLPLRQFDVSLDSDEPVTLLNTNGDAQEAAHWSIRELHPASGYMAAVAVKGHDLRLTCWNWPEEHESLLATLAAIRS